MTEELGPFRKVDPSVVEDDPFWAAVRRRHPDVEVVLLPDEPAAGVAAGPVAGADSVEAAVAALRDAWGVVRPLLAGYGVTGPPSVRWSGSPPRQSLVLQRAAAGIGAGAGVDLLRELVARLAPQDWTLEPGERRGVPALRAAGDGASLEAVAGPGATVVTVSGASLTVTTDLRDAVGDRVRAEVGSWQ